MGETIISGLVFGAVALFMIGIGVSQLKSKDPVGFYSGEKPPKKEQLSDVKAWNRKHGRMWIVYGICIACSWVCSAPIWDSVFCVIPLLTGTLVPVVVMILYHHHLIKTYFIQ